MFKATKRTLTAAAVIVAASGPSAYARPDLNPSPRGVAIVQAQAQPASPVARPNADEQMPQTSDPGVQNGLALERQRETVPSRSSPGVRAPALFGGAGTPYPGTTVTRYPGLVPGSTTTRYAGLTGLAALNHEQAVAEKALAANLRNHASEASRLTVVRAPVVATAGGGFDWGDGAIGALVVLGVVAAGFGATVLVRRWTSSLARTES